MDQIELEVTNREILGKKVRFLRRQGITPVHLFGHGIQSMTLQCNTDRLQWVLAEAGKTRLLSLKLDSEKRPRAAVVREVQAEPRTGELFHVDFYQVEMAEQVKIEVPIVVVGEAPVLKSKENTLVQELDTLTVECLPAKIPPSIEVDVSAIAEADEVVRVKDIELDEEVTVLSDPELVLVRVSSRPIEKLEEVAVEEEVAPVEAAEEVPSAERESKES